MTGVVLGFYLLGMIFLNIVETKCQLARVQYQLHKIADQGIFVRYFRKTVIQNYRPGWFDSYIISSMTMTFL